MKQNTPARVLIVCTANAIRSPFVEHLLRARLAGAGIVEIEVVSAGTAARPGRAAEPRAVRLGREHGLDLAAHRARRLDEATVSASTIVLCAAAAHRRTVLDLRPDALATTFTVREFARLLREEPGASVEGGWDPLVRSLARGRTRLRPTSVVDDDLVDPIGQDETVWREFEQHAVQAVEPIAAAVGRALAGERTSTESPPMTRREMRARRASSGGIPGILSG